jgi:ParB family chromosome partitioning protein
MTEPPDGGVAVSGAEPDSLPSELMSPAMIPVDRLRSNPRNAREDLDLSDEFVASIAEFGIRKPLQVTPDDDGGFLVIDGNRRLAGAIQAGRVEVPCYLDPEAAADKASQFLDMVVGNGAGYRRNFTPVEEATALFAASQAGATRTRIRKVTGRSAAQVKTALAAGGLSPQTRDAAGDMAAQLDLDQLALLAEFDGDPAAVDRIVGAMRIGYPAEHEAERIRQQRAEAAEHDRLVAELEAAGVTVTDSLPNGAIPLRGLLHDGDDLIPENHVSCPGRGAYFLSWSPLEPVHYCASPDENGHTEPDYGLPAEGGTEDNTSSAYPGVGPRATPDGEPDPSRRLVIEGNKAWKAAGEVRKRWLATHLFARRAAPREAARFVAGQLLAMPEPLRRDLAAAPGMTLFAEVTRQSAASWLEIADTTAAARLPLLMLGPIVTAYEHAMTNGEGRNTWRTDRYAPCPLRDAGAYLTFLASVGYELSTIEQALADGTPYTGEPPDGPVLDVSSSEPAPDGEASPDDISPGTQNASTAPADANPDSGVDGIPDETADAPDPVGDSEASTDAERSSDHDDPEGSASGAPA